MDDNQPVGNNRQIVSDDIAKKAEQIKAQVAESAKNFQKRNRVTNTTIFLMISVALFYDLLQFGLDGIPIAGWILSGLVGIYAWLTFYLWTSIKGWGFADTAKKWIVWLLEFLGCIGPFNIGPEITAGVILTILIVKSDDFIYNRTKGKVDSQIIKQGVEFFNLFRDVDK